MSDNLYPMGEIDADGLDAVEALVADAAAAEPSRLVHEGGEYYAERIIRRAIAQGTLALASGTLAEGGDVKQAPGASPSGPPAESGDAQPSPSLSLPLRTNGERE